MSADLRLEELFHEADQLIKEGAFQEAVSILEGILAENPSFGKAYNHLGWVYETKVQDLAKAEEYYQLALKFAPEYTATYYNYAILLATLKKYEELDLHLARALNVKGINKASIYNEYGLMYESLGMYDQAILSYREYIRNLFDTKLVELAYDAMERCKRKKEILD